MLADWSPSGDPAGLSYIETDAHASGGASGGALVSEVGEVVGIVELLFRDTGFTLAIPAREAVDRARAILRGEDVSGLGDRRVASMLGRAALTDRFTLASQHDARAYLLRPLTDGMVRVDSMGHAPTLAAYDESGVTLDTGMGATSTWVEFRGVAGRACIIVAGQDDDDALSPYNVVATQSLQRITDPDDGKLLSLGRPMAESIDYPGDLDFFAIDLVEGQTVTATASSVLFDAGLVVQSPNPAQRALSDSDHGGGLTDLDARLAFTATRTGRYRIAVVREGDTGLGGYLLTVVASAPSRRALGAGRITGGALVSSGMASVVFGGGTSDELVVASGCGRTELRFWATAPKGDLVLYAPAAPEAANARWEELFPFGIPADTPLVAVCGGSVTAPPPAPTPRATPRPSTAPGGSPTSSTMPRVTFR